MDAIMELLERRGPSGAQPSLGDPEGLSPDLEGHYQVAKARLLAAQQEKTEATAEFLTLRATLVRRMERLWPGEESGRGAWFDAEVAAGV